MSAEPFRAALVANTLGFADTKSLSVTDLPLTDGTYLNGTSAVTVTGNYALVTSSTQPFRAALALNTLGLATADSLDCLAQSSARVPGRPLERLRMHPPILGRGGIALEGAEVNPYYPGFQQRHIPLERVPGHEHEADVLKSQSLQQQHIPLEPVTCVDTNSLSVIDVTDKTSPTLVGGLTNANDLNGAWSVVVLGNYALAASSSADSLSVIDATSDNGACYCLNGCSH